jgi:threonine dehydratase
MEMTRLGFQDILDAADRIRGRAHHTPVLTYDPERECREDIAEELLQEQGCVLVPPFDHPHVIAGQGTAARELVQAVGALGLAALSSGRVSSRGKTGVVISGGNIDGATMTDILG